ncbi:MAG: hypothetical protein ACXVXQ_10550, partial [Mycobacteriaceae bacterium]
MPTWLGRVAVDRACRGGLLEGVEQGGERRVRRIQWGQVKPRPTRWQNSRSRGSVARRGTTQLPRELADLPLVAEYYERNAPGGWAALKHHLLGQFGRPAGGHHRRFA